MVLRHCGGLLSLKRAPPPRCRNQRALGTHAGRVSGGEHVRRRVLGITRTATADTHWTCSSGLRRTRPQTPTQSTWNHIKLPARTTRAACACGSASRARRESAWLFCWDSPSRPSRFECRAFVVVHRLPQLSAGCHASEGGRQTPPHSPAPRQSAQRAWAYTHCGVPSQHQGLRATPTPLLLHVLTHSCRCRRC